MSWGEVPQRDLDEVAAARERATIRATVPYGWESHYNWLTYGVVSADRTYGLCHCTSPQVCLLSGVWRHPYPLPPSCPNPPTLIHAL